MVEVSMYIMLVLSVMQQHDLLYVLSSIINAMDKVYMQQLGIICHLHL